MMFTRKILRYRLLTLPYSPIMFTRTSTRAEDTVALKVNRKIKTIHIHYKNVSNQHNFFKTLWQDNIKLWRNKMKSDTQEEKNLKIINIELIGLRLR